MSQTAPRIAMISGASRGIGAAIAEHLAGAGWALSLGMRKPRPVGNALVHAYDAAQPDAEAEWVAATVARFGRIDAIICNAGIATFASVIDATEAPLAERLAGH